MAHPSNACLLIQTHTHTVARYSFLLLIGNSPEVQPRRKGKNEGLWRKMIRFWDEKLKPTQAVRWTDTFQRCVSSCCVLLPDRLRPNTSLPSSIVSAPSVDFVFDYQRNQMWPIRRSCTEQCRRAGRWVRFVSLIWNSCCALPMLIRSIPAPHPHTSYALLQLLLATVWHLMPSAVPISISSGSFPSPAATETPARQVKHERKHSVLLRATGANRTSNRRSNTTSAPSGRTWATGKRCWNWLFSSYIIFHLISSSSVRAVYGFTLAVVWSKGAVEGLWIRFFRIVCFPGITGVLPLVLWAGNKL